MVNEPKLSDLTRRERQIIEAIYRSGKAYFHAQVHVFRVRGRFLALCCTAPRGLHKELEADYRRICGSVQLTRDDFVPKPQGPLKRAPLKKQ